MLVHHKKAVTFLLWKGLSERGKCLRRVDATEGTHLLGGSGGQNQLMLGRCIFSATPKGSGLLSEALMPWVLGWSHSSSLMERCHSRVL